MSEHEILMAFYEKIVAENFPYAGEIPDEQNRLKATSVRGCHGDSTNILYFSVSVENGLVRAIRYDCRYCDVIMYITAELICRLLDQQPIRRLAEISDAQITALLGGQSPKVLRQARISLGLLKEGLLHDDTTA